MLVSILLFLNTFYPEEIERFRGKLKLEKFNSGDVKELKSANKKTFKAYLFIAIYMIINILPAAIIAGNCGRSKVVKIIVMPFAILFSDLYMLFYVFRRYIQKDMYFCFVKELFRE